MNSIFKKTITLLIGDDVQIGLPKYKKAPQITTITERDLLREESKIGAVLFGEIPKGHRREFFCLDERTWVWHEEWADDAGKQHIRTTRYDVRPQGIFKAQNGQTYQPINRQETSNLIAAIKRYNRMIDAELEPLLRGTR